MCLRIIVQIHVIFIKNMHSALWEKLQSTFLTKQIRYINIRHNLIVRLHSWFNPSSL